jgi:adenosine deaminase
MFFDPQGHTARGVEFSTVINGLHRAIADAERELGVRASLIMCFLRHLDEADAEKTLDSRAGVSRQDCRRRPGFIGNRTSAEQIQTCIQPRPRRRFLSHGPCRRGRAAELHLGSARRARRRHESITAFARWKIRSLVGRLAREKMALTVCPLSNLRLRVVDDLASSIRCAGCWIRD